MKYAVAVFALLLSACGPGNTPQPPTPQTGAVNAGTASSSCSARNDVGKDCNVTCKSGEAAVCRNGSGTNEPRCTCSP